MAKPKKQLFKNLRIGQEIVKGYLVKEKELDSFAKLSGDFNKLHSQKEFAQKKGFKDIVIHGALVIAKISSILGMEFPGEDCILIGMNIKFAEPIYLNEKFFIKLNIKKLSSSVSMIIFDLKVISNEKVKYYGEISVINKT